MKNILCLLIVLALLSTLFVACNTPPTQLPQTDSQQPLTDNTAEESFPPEDTIQESPVSDFKYREEDSEIIITEYIGTASNVTIPSTIDGKKVTTIGASSFWLAQEFLSIVSLPDTIITIERNAFEQCTNLTSIVLSQNLKTIERDVFNNCINLKDVVLPNSLTHLGNNAFHSCTSLKRINIPPNISWWGDLAFSDCKLEQIDLAEGLTFIPDYAFRCTNIQNLIVPSSVKEIGIRAFEACLKLESVHLSEGLVTIESGAFRHCTNLAEFTVPSTVVNITEIVFDECHSLQKVYFEGNAPQNYVYINPPLEGLKAENVFYTVFYRENSIGFTSPEWCGYPTEIW